jgi:hypothetical protein
MWGMMQFVFQAGRRFEGFFAYCLAVFLPYNLLVCFELLKMKEKGDSEGTEI